MDLTKIDRNRVEKLEVDWASSYHDWELQFRKKSKKKSFGKNDYNKLNSLGIPKAEYKRFITEWRAKNSVFYK